MFFTDIFFSVLAEKTFLTVINDILDHFLPFGVTFSLTPFPSSSITPQYS